MCWNKIIYYQSNNCMHVNYLLKRKIHFGYDTNLTTHFKQAMYKFLGSVQKDHRAKHSNNIRSIKYIFHI